MQKKLIALAIAGLASSAAFAQSNVTVYGVADAALVTSKTDGATRQNLVSSGALAASRLGFKGSEDLGNGLKAIFALEYRLEIDGNNPVGYSTTVGSAGPARQQLVGLSDAKFGTFVAGRLQTTGYDWALKYDILAGSAFSPLQNVNASDFLIGGTTVAARANNAVAYISPSFAGVTVALNHAEATEQTLDTTTVNQTWDMASISYDNGPLSAGFVYATAKDNSNLGTVDTATYTNVGNKANEWALGASYDFNVVKLAATYQSRENEGNGITGVRTNSIDAWSISAAVPVTAKGKVMLGYAQNSIDNKDAIAQGTDFDTKSWSLGYTHALSKRTTAYAAYTNIDRGNAVGIKVNQNGTTATANNVFGAGTDTFGIGLNHKF